MSFAISPSEWDDLVARSRRPLLFMTHDWQAAWWDTFGVGAELHVLALREPAAEGASGSLAGLAPLYGRGDELELLGGGEVCDYLDVVAVPGAEASVLRHLLDHFAAGRWTTLRLNAIPDDSPTRTLLPAIAAEHGWTVEDVVDDVCPRLTLLADYESYLASLDKKDRHELRRKFRRLESTGQVRFYAVEPGVLTDQDIADFLRLHRLDERKAAFMDEAMERFFRAILARFQPTGLARLYFLELDGVRVSTVILFDYAAEYWLYNSGYDPAYQHAAVGLLIKALTLEEAIARGRIAYDFLQGAEPYKYDLGATDAHVHRLTITKRAGFAHADSAGIHPASATTGYVSG